MKLAEAFSAVRDLQRIPRDPDIAFDYIAFGGPANLFNHIDQTDGVYPTQALRTDEGGRGGAYLYVDEHEEVLYVGKSCGEGDHGARNSGIATEAISKISAPRWVNKPDVFGGYDLRPQLAGREPVSTGAAEAVRKGRFYLGFIVVRDERTWSVPALQCVARDLERHLLYVYRQMHDGALPPLNARDDSGVVDTGTPWGV